MVTGGPALLPGDGKGLLAASREASRSSSFRPAPWRLGITGSAPCVPASLMIAAVGRRSPTKISWNHQGRMQAGGLVTAFTSRHYHRAEVAERAKGDDPRPYDVANAMTRNRSARARFAPLPSTSLVRAGISGVSACFAWIDGAIRNHCRASLKGLALNNSRRLICAGRDHDHQGRRRHRTGRRAR